MLMASSLKGSTYTATRRARQDAGFMTLKLVASHVCQEKQLKNKTISNTSKSNPVNYIIDVRSPYERHEPSTTSLT